MPNKGRGTRNFKKEYQAFHGKPEQIKRRAQRNTARADAVKRVGKAALKGKDVHHPTSKKNGSLPKKTRIISRHKNRSMNRK
jgi:hypothetical protein